MQKRTTKGTNPLHSSNTRCQSNDVAYLVLPIACNSIGITNTAAQMMIYTASSCLRFFSIFFMTAKLQQAGCKKTVEDRFCEKCQRTAVLHVPKKKCEKTQASLFVVSKKSKNVLSPLYAGSTPNIWAAIRVKEEACGARIILVACRSLLWFSRHRRCIA